MRDIYINKLKEYFPNNPFQETTLFDNFLYVYDDNIEHKTFMVNTKVDNSFEIENKLAEVSHICIDGDFIEFGKQDYSGNGYSQKRPDSMVFNDIELLIVELKSNVTFDTEDKTKWGEFSNGLKKMSDFWNFLIKGFVDNQDDIKNYYNLDNIKPIICMSFYPSFERRRNSQRFNQIEKFRIETGLKVLSKSEYVFN